MKNLVLLGGAALLALGAGLWFASQRAPTPTPGQTAPVASANQSAAAPFNGKALLALFKDGKLNAPKGRSASYDAGTKYTVVNFWATWCAPCVEELPMLEKLSQQSAFATRAGLVGIAVDSPTSVADFLTKMSLSFPLAVAGLEGGPWMRALGNDSAAMPFTVILDAAGQVKYKKLGKVEEVEITAALAKLP